MLSAAILAGDEINGRVLGAVVTGLGGLAVIAFAITLGMAAFFRSKKP